MYVLEEDSFPQDVLHIRKNCYLARERDLLWEQDRVDVAEVERHFGYGRKNPQLSECS